MQTHAVRRALVGLLMLAAAAPVVRADATSAARKAIQAAYNRENAAAARRDVAGAYANTTPDYVAIDKGGRRVTLAAAKQNASQIFPLLSNVKATTTIKKIVVKGGRATVTVSEKAQATLTSPQSGQNGTLVMTSTSNDLWVLSGKRWLKKQSRILTSNGTLNGKPVPGM